MSLIDARTPARVRSLAACGHHGDEVATVAVTELRRFVEAGRSGCVTYWHAGPVSVGVEQHFRSCYPSIQPVTFTLNQYGIAHVRRI